jgi:hypothetical protein
MQGWTYREHIPDLTMPMNSSHTVLIVDDTYEERILLKRYLKKIKKTELPLVILEGSSGEEGIDIFSTSIDKLVSK